MVVWFLCDSERRGEREMPIRYWMMMMMMIIVRLQRAVRRKANSLSIWL